MLCCGQCNKEINFPKVAHSKPILDKNNICSSIEIYCSSRCYKLSKQSKSKTYIGKSCLICDKSFQTWVPHTKYCSEQCARLAARIVKYDGSIPDNICIVCERPFLSYKKRKTCSNSCGIKHKKSVDKDYRIKNPRKSSDNDNNRQLEKIEIAPRKRVLVKIRNIISPAVSLYLIRKEFPELYHYSAYVENFVHLLPSSEGGAESLAAT